MTTNDIPHVAKHMLAKHGLTQLGWGFEWDRAKRRAGKCSYRTKTISLSLHYVELNVVDRLGDVIDTILHEIAHALAGPGTNHGPKWVEACHLIGAAPVRCYDSSVVTMPKGKYVATCGGCSRKFYRHTKPPFTKLIYCVACGPALGTLRYIQSDTQPATHVGLPVAPTPRKMR